MIHLVKYVKTFDTESEFLTSLPVVAHWGGEKSTTVLNFKWNLFEQLKKPTYYLEVSIHLHII